MKNTIEYFYNYADDNCIKILNYPFNDLKGLFYTHDNQDYIFLNYNKIKNVVEEKCVLAEECGHYSVGAIPINIYNNDYSNTIINSKNEFKAFKWALDKLIPPDKFKEFLGRNLTKYEVANELEVTEEFLEKAYNYYCNVDFT